MAPAPVHAVELPYGVGRPGNGAPDSVVSQASATKLAARHETVGILWCRRTAGRQDRRGVARYGLKAVVWRGERPLNPDADDLDKRMCLDSEAVKIAQSARMSAQTTVCEGKDPRGRSSVSFFRSCSYQLQKEENVRIRRARHAVAPERAYRLRRRDRRSVLAKRSMDIENRRHAR